jgi:DNA invertase Pin-like site-specific DNA recombinase
LQVAGFYAAIPAPCRASTWPIIAPPFSGRIGGRPPALSDADIAAAKALLADPNITTKDVAKRMNVSLSTLYRHLPAARATITHGETA